MRAMSELCFYLSKRRILSRSLGDAGENPATFDSKSYHDWRTSELTKQFLDNFETAALTGLDVLDFGCGEGDLSFLVANLPVKSITGIDLHKDRVKSAISRLQDMNLTTQLRFICGNSPATIDMSDASVDVILCFDVLEHIMDYNSIISEWKRILRSRGRILIWWVPWLHPYGHHIESLVPLPWAHVLFSDKVLLETCARIYDMPNFRPRIWDLDEKGSKKPNKWVNMIKLPDVNRLTIGKFERVCSKAGLVVVDRRIKGFGSRSGRLTNICTHVPLLREFFSSSVIYTLQRRD